MTGKIMGIFDSTPATQTSTAPSWQTGYQNYGLNQALSQYQNTQNLVAPFAPQQEQAISNITNLANRGDPGTNAAGNFITNTLNGNVQQNPQLNALFSQGANQIQNQLASQFAGAGRNVDQSQGANALALGTFGANLYGNAFGQEAGLQQAALGAAPGNLQSQLGLQSSLYGAGQNVQNQSQQYINAPQNFLNQYLSEVNGALGQTTSGTPAFNAGAGALGGGIVGSGLGGAIGNALGGSSGSGWGQLAGGLLGAYAGGN
jgi:hypothetical protein